MTIEPNFPCFQPYSSQSLMVVGCINKMNLGFPKLPFLTQCFQVSLDTQIKKPTNQKILKSTKLLSQYE